MGCVFCHRWRKLLWALDISPSAEPPEHNCLYKRLAEESS